MKIPRSIPCFRLAVTVVGLCAAAWMIFEGDLRRDVLLAAAGLLLGVVYLIGRRWGGRSFSPGRVVAGAAAIGFIYGLGLVLLVLFLMALKTGLHAHGPEYTPDQVAWVWGQLPVWGGAGALTGLGAGLLLVARGDR